MEKGRQIHRIAPVYDENSRVLILGSFPSVKSRSAAFFYAHPQNRFWPVLAAVLGEKTPAETQARRALALRRGVAIWDVIASCEIAGSSDGSIEAVVPNDLTEILRAAGIRAIFCNGGAAYAYYNRLCRAQTGRGAQALPSTSPANARWSREMLTQRWREALLPYLSGDGEPNDRGGDRRR